MKNTEKIIHNETLVEKKQVSVRLPLDLDAAVTGASDQRGITKIEWMVEAAREKLSSSTATEAAGLLHGLSPRNQERVRDLAAFLRTAPEGLADASDMSLSILKRALREIEIAGGKKRGSKRGRKKENSTDKG